MLWRRCGQAMWRLRYVGLQALLVAATAWVLWPLREASALPLPPWPAYTPEPPDQQETLVVDQATFTPGTQGAARVVVYDPGRGAPLPGARVRVSLAPHDRPDDLRHVLYQGSSDDQGTVPARFQVPPLTGSEWDLVVDVQGPVGAQRLVRPIATRRETRLELATDRLVYAPGQTLHLWLRALDGHPPLPLSEQAVLWSVADARGTLLCRGRASTSAYGVAHASCGLAKGIAPGSYRVRALLGDETAPDTPDAERLVRVEPSTPDHFAVKLDTDERYALAGGRLMAAVQATYWWGQPIAGAQVEVIATLAGEPEREVGRVQGETDEEGVLHFALNVGGNPGSGREPNAGILRLTARVTDVEGRAQVAETRLPVAEQALLIQAEAESGALRMGIDNQVYVHISYPDGRPAACVLTVDGPGMGEPIQIETDASGRGRVTYRPPDGAGAASLLFTARDAQGSSARERIELPVTAEAPFLTLRPERTSYRPGETMRVSLGFAVPEGAPAPCAAYLDVVRAGQMVAVHSAPMDGEQAALDIPLADGWSGPITLRAYVLLAEDVPIAVARTVSVEPSGSLTVTVQPDKEEYAPGDTARVSIHVIGAKGSGIESSLAVAMGPVAPERDAVQLPASAPPTGEGDELRLARTGALSKARPTPEGVVRQFEAVAFARQVRRQAFTALAARLMMALAVTACLACASALAAAWSRPVREGTGLRAAVRATVGSTLGALIVLPLLLGASALLAYGSGRLFGPGSAIVLGLAWLAVLLTWVVYAWQRGSGWVQVLWASVLCALALGVGLRQTLVQGAQLPGTWIVAGLAALAAAVLAFYLLAVTLTRRAERVGAAAVWALVVTVLVTSTGAVLVGVPAQEVRSPLPGTPSVVQAAPPLEAQISVDPEAVGAGFSRSTAGVGLPRPTMGAGTPRPYEEVDYWNPDAVTDDRGRLTVDIPIPGQGTAQIDQIFTVVASGLGGEYGAGQAHLGVSRPPWIETALPAALTVGDELDLPISVHNSLPLSQTVQITVTQASWFNTRVREGRTQQIEVAGHDVGAIYVPIRVREWGKQTLEVVAQGEQWSERLLREVDVTPGGLRVWRAYDGQVESALKTAPVPPDALPPGLAPPAVDGEEEPPPETRLRFRVPWSAVSGSERVTVTLYPHWESVLAESLEAAGSPASPLAGGRMDAVAATIRAGALRHAYLADRSAEDSGATRTQAGIRAALGLSYQELLAFEAADGGFAALARAPPDVYHTAEALSCLSELARLIPADRSPADRSPADRSPVDEALIERTARWLYREQTDEGTWLPSPVPSSWQGLPRLELPATAYAAWSLIEAGYGDTPEVRLAIEHLARYLDPEQDPYVLALMANALAAYSQMQPEPAHDEALAVALALLAEKAEVEGDVAAWRGATETFTGAVGDAADVERTALAVYALLRPHLRAPSDPHLAAKGLTWLVRQRDGAGGWGSGTTNGLAMRTLLAAVRWGKPPYLSATVFVTVDKTGPISTTVHSIGSGARSSLGFASLSKGYNDVVLSAEGLGSVPYRVVGTYILPWDQVVPSAPEEDEVSIEVSYDRTAVAVGEAITATVDVVLVRPGVAPWVVLELGLPPGLELVEDEWEELVRDGTIARHRRAGERMIVHLADLSADAPVRLTYHLRARFPLSVQTLPTRAYDAANPGRPAVRAPVRIEVK